jgi:hypothetical protein
VRLQTCAAAALCSGPTDVLNPWNFTLYNPNYVGDEGAWNVGSLKFNTATSTFSGTRETNRIHLFLFDMDNKIF